VEKLGVPDARLNSRLLQAQSRKEGEAQGFSDYWESDFKKIATLEFTRDRKSMGVIGRAKGPLGARENTLYVKGAPENILERCDSYLTPDGSVEKLTPALKSKIEKEVTDV